MSARALFASALVLAACTHATRSSDAVLERRPAVAELKPFAAPVPKVRTLANGLKLYIVEKPGDGIEAVELVVKRGAADDPPALPGVASLAMDMLEAGSAGRSQTDMAAASDSIGASLHAGAGADGSVISGSAMAINIEPLVALFADVALRPNFADAEWQRITSQRQADLLAARAEPGVGAARAFSAAVYGDHPYGKPSEGTVESVKSMKLDDAKAFFARFDPRSSALVAVGGVPEARMAELLTKVFEGWRAATPSADKGADLPQARPAPAERPRAVVVDFGDKPQTVLRIGQPAASRSSPDVMALRVWNSVLGGSFTSRLSQNLRELHGYTYGASSRFSFGIGPGPFVAGADVKTEVTADALKEALAELARAVDQPITGAELAKAKALLAFDIAQLLEHADGAASAVGQLFLYDLPPDEFATFVARLEKLTPADVLAAARRSLDPAKMTIVLAGDGKKIAAQLTAAGLPAPEQRDVTGRLVAR